MGEIWHSPVASPAPIHTSTPTAEVTHHCHNEVIIKSKEKTYGLCFLITMVRSIKFCTQFSLSATKIHLDSDTVCAVHHPIREQI